MDAQHTPGPWSAFTDDSGSRPHTNIVAVNPRTDCVFSLPGHHKKEPNVQLIAAAPTMLKALRIVASTLPHIGGREMATDSLMREVNAAIAQATA